MENFIRTARLAEYLDVCPETIYRWAQAGMPFTRVGPELRFKVSEVESWLTERAAGGQAGSVLSLTQRRSAVKPRKKKRYDARRIAESLDRPEFEAAS